MPIVRARTIITPLVWIPPSFTAIYKLTVDRIIDGTTDDITDLISSGEIEDGTTETIGRFEFEIWDPNETYVNAWQGGETVKYYSDYGTSADTLRFRGKIEKVSRTGMKLKVTGRSESVVFLGLTVTKQYSNTEVSVILKALIDAYSVGFTYTNVNTSTTNLSVNWYQKPFWEVVQELCTAAQFDAYVDSNKDWHFFAHGTVLNPNEAIVHEYNLVEIGDFAQDLTQVRNRIIVYGAEQEGTQIIYTKETPGLSPQEYKEEIINDSNVTSDAQAKDLGDFMYEKLKNPPTVGEIKGILLATIQPGEKIRLSSPQDNINPDYYEIVSYKHNIGDQFYTTVKVSKEPRRISHIFKDIIQAAHSKEQTYINPSEMRYSYNFLFNEDSGTHTTTQIINGVLKLSSGSSGNWVSLPKTALSNVSQCYLIANGETLTGATFQVSGDNGVNYQTINNKEKINLSNTGTSLILKITFSNADTQVDSASILYK